jgi:hypothetical protein
MATLVYRYGLLPPTTNADLARRHLRAAHRYTNLLIEIERGRRAALRQAEQADPALQGVDAAIAWLDAECAQIATAVKAARGRNRQRDVRADLRADLRERRALLKRAKRGRGLYRALWSLPRLQTERDRINTLDAELRRSLRRHRRFWAGEQLYHGTYCACENAASAARKAPLWKGAQPNDPHFRRWRGESRQLGHADTVDGTLGCQLQGGETWASLTEGQGTKVQIVRQGLPARACRPGRPGVHRRCSPEACTLLERDPSRARSNGRGRRHAVLLRMRQETNQDGPVWVEWPMQRARSLPQDARVMHVEVHARVVPGDLDAREEWYATLTLRVPDTPRRNDGLAVAVDVGWRALPDGSLRVAYWCGEDGRHDQLVLTPRMVSSLTRSDGIRAARDRGLDDLRAGLVGWIDATPEASRPEWLQRARRHMHSWRSPKRFRRLLAQWQQHQDVPAPPAPRPEPAQALAALGAWVRRDHHLAGYEHGQRAKAQRRRQDHYRRFAAWLSQRYDVVVLEDFDKRQTGTTSPTEDGAQTEGVHLRHAQRLAWTSGLCQVLKSRFGQRGIWAAHDPANTTRACHHCDGTLVGDAADGIMQRCTNGHVWDQDENAARNLLEGWSCERSGGEDSPITARSDKVAKKEKRWDRARRLRADKVARVAAAREASDNAAE